MIARTERFETGWIGVSLALGAGEIDELIRLLQSLRDSQISHFHISSTDFSSAPSLADIEVSIKGVQEIDNMTFG